MAVRPEEIASIIKQQIEQFGGELTAVDVGSVVSAGDEHNAADGSGDSGDYGT